MIEKKPVSVNWQMVFVLIPFLDIYASYRIQKLRLWLLIFLVGFGIVVLLLDYAIFGMHFDDITNKDHYLDPYFRYIHILLVIVTLGTAVFVIRKWSISWNKRLESKN